MICTVSEQKFSEQAYLKVHRLSKHCFFSPRILIVSFTFVTVIHTSLPVKLNFCFAGLGVVQAGRRLVRYFGARKKSIGKKYINKSVIDLSFYIQHKDYPV